MIEIQVSRFGEALKVALLSLYSPPMLACWMVEVSQFRVKRSVKMKREYLEELRALINSIRSGGKERRRKSPGSRAARVRPGFLGNVPQLARAVVRVGASRKSIYGLVARRGRQDLN